MENKDNSNLLELLQQYVGGDKGGDSANLLDIIQHFTSGKQDIGGQSSNLLDIVQNLAAAGLSGNSLIEKLGEMTGFQRKSDGKGNFFGQIRDFVDKVDDNLPTN
jgi:hypothetical protein